MELRDFAQQLLFGSRLQDKLFSPDQLTDLSPGLALPEAPKQPARPSELAFPSGSHRATLPSRKQLEQETSRGHLLHFFANHELLAIELMALALLRFPDAGMRVRRALVGTIFEEQKHLRLYIDRMQELGVGFGEIPVNAFFWNSLSKMNCMEQYFAGMSLTFEQANLDYALFYHKLMTQLQDESTAAILKTVLQDELGHVALGLTELRRHRTHEQDLFETQRSWLLPPLTMERAKGLHFNRAEHQSLRRQLGFPDSYIQQLQAFVATKGRPVDVFWYNPDCELEWKHGRGYQRSRIHNLLISDLAPLMALIAKPGDLVLAQKPPGLRFQARLRDLGLPFVRYLSVSKQSAELPADVLSLHSFRPWGWTDSALKLAKTLSENWSTKVASDWGRQVQLSQIWSDKKHVPRLRADLRRTLDLCEQRFGSVLLDGVLFEDHSEIVSYLRQMWQSDPQQSFVVKSVYGAAGSAMKRFYSEQDFSPSNLGWLQSNLVEGRPLLVEPWLYRLIDLSAVVAPGSQHVQISEFMTDARGQYRGHRLGGLGISWTAAIRRWFFTEQFGESVFASFKRVAEFIFRMMRDQGFQGAAGIDAFIAIDPRHGDFCLRFLSEINARYTMAHMALALQRHLMDDADQGLWRIFSASEIKKLGFESPAKFANWLKNDLSLNANRSLVITNDPEQALGCLTVLAPNQEATIKLEAIGKD